MRTLRAVLDLYPSARTSGLSPEHVVDSQSRFGFNRLTPLPRTPMWMAFLAKFDEPIIKILLAASLLKIVVDLFDAAAWVGVIAFLSVPIVFALSFVDRLAQWVPAGLFALACGWVGVSIGMGHPSYEGLAVMAAVALATGVAFLSEYRSAKEFEVLNAHKDAIQVKCIRGELQMLPLEEVVVGDVIVLEAGDEIPADGRPITATELSVDQSLMSGESEAVEKIAAADDDDREAPDQPVCLFRGTYVVGGTARMIVTNVGDDTMLGQIARRLGGEQTSSNEQASRVQQKLNANQQTTPLQEKLTVLADRISKLGYLAAIAIFLALFVRGIVVGELRWPFHDEAWGKVLLANFRSILSYFVYMVIVIVVAVPEGLPMSVTVSLALAMRKMTRANSLVRQLAACETIGSATVICTDKTGTLTQNRMTVDRIFGDSPLLRTNAAINSTATLTEREGVATVIGNSTEGALLTWLKLQGEPNHRANVAIVFQAPFSSDRKRMTTVIADGEKHIVFVKGAPESLLADCPDLTQADVVRAELSRSANDAMRTLAFAHRELHGVTVQDIEAMAKAGTLDRGLTFDGFASIRDPLRPEVPAAVQACHSAGIAIIMMTGDNLQTATAIARDAGILRSADELVMASDELEKLSDAELAERLPRLRVLARARPLDKYRLVRLLQDAGHVVAMTGDGTNDAPSLKRADVGLSMGLSGTEVAKEASDIVLLDDSFGTIVKAVHWGRALYENIQRFIQFQLTINVSALAIAFLGPLVGLRPPFTVLQLLWINVIMDTFAAIALCSEPPRLGLMRLPPKKRGENIITRAMLKTILSTATFFIVIMMTLLMGMQHYDWLSDGGERSREFPQLTYHQVSMFFTIYVLFQVWNQINCRSLTPRVSALRGLFRNRPFLTIVAFTLLGQFLIVTFGGRETFQLVPLGWLDWLGITLGTASVLLFAEVVRRIRRSGGE